MTHIPHSTLRESNTGQHNLLNELKHQTSSIMTVKTIKCTHWCRGKPNLTFYIPDANLSSIMYSDCNNKHKVFGFTF